MSVCSLKSHDFRNHIKKFVRMFFVILRILQKYLKRGSHAESRRDSETGKMKNYCEKIMHGNEAEGNYTNVLIQRWQEVKEHSWSSAKAIFITRSNSLPCMSYVFPL